MNGKEKNYSIHDIVTFRVVYSTNFVEKFLSFLDTRYRNFESIKKNQPDFIIHLGKFSPSNNSCYLLDDKYYIKKDYFYCKDSQKFSKWQFEMQGFEGGTIVAKIETNLFGNLSVPINIIDFLIHFKMNEKGFPLVHASGVSKEQNAFIFSARGGGGKTTIAQHFVKNGFDFLGDNFIILGNSKILSFLSPLNIFTYNLTEETTRNLAIINRLLIAVNYLIYKISLGYIKVATQVNVKNLFPTQLINESELRAIFLLIPGKKLRLKSITKLELIDHFVINQKLEFFQLPIFRYSLAYSYVFPESKLSFHWEEYKEQIIKNIGKNVSIYLIEIPKQINMEIIQKLNKLIVKNIKKR